MPYLPQISVILCSSLFQERAKFFVFTYSYSINSAITHARPSHMTNCTSFSNVAACNANSACSWVNNACVCNEGYGTASNSNICSPCVGQNFKSSKGNAACISCGQNKAGTPSNYSILASLVGPNTKCTCVPDYGFVNSVCVLCNRTNQYIGFKRVCYCQAGYIQQSDGTCVQGTSSCTGIGQAPIVGSTTICTCQPGYGTTEVVNSSTIQCTQCRDIEYKDTLNASRCARCSDQNAVVASDFPDQSVHTKCVCKKGYAGTAYYSNTCMQCVGSTYSPADNTLECIACPDNNAVGRPDANGVGNSKCVCKKGFAGTGMSPNSCIECTGSTYTDVDGQTSCTQCPDPNAVGQQDSGSPGNIKCVCKAGYAGTGNTTGSCSECTGKKYTSSPGQLTCSTCSDPNAVGSNPNNESGNTECICMAGFALYQNNCVNCTGEGQVIDSNTKACKCGLGYIQQADGSCIPNPVKCDQIGQIHDPEKNYLCVCKPGYGGDGTPSPDIVCAPCTNELFKGSVSAEPCGPCQGLQIAVPQNAFPSAGAHGPNIMCINRGTCKDPACKIDKSCSASFCASYAEGCVLANSSACACDSSKNYDFDSKGGCVQGLNKQGGPAFGIIVGAVILVIAISAIILTAVMKQQKVKQLVQQKDATTKVVEYL